MAAWGSVLLILGILALIEGLIVLIFPKWTISISKKWLKPKFLKKAGWIEVVIAIILILIGMNI